MKPKLTIFICCFSKTSKTTKNIWIIKQYNTFSVFIFTFTTRGMLGEHSKKFENHNNLTTRFSLRKFSLIKCAILLKTSEIAHHPIKSCERNQNGKAIRQLLSVPFRRLKSVLTGKSFWRMLFSVRKLQKNASFVS